MNHRAHHAVSGETFSDHTTFGVNSTPHRMTTPRYTLALVASLFGLSLGNSALAEEPQKRVPKARLVTTEVLAPVEEVTPADKASSGVVILQRAGQQVGLGTILNDDGRILTALSGLGPGGDLDAKYADGSVQKVRVGHRSAVWDLALLVPQTGKWKTGLTAASSDPLREGSETQSFSVTKGKPAPIPLELRNARQLLGDSDQVLPQAFEVATRVLSKDLGAPIVDEKAHVVGVLGRACLPIEGGPCAPIPYGIPVSTIKQFLRSVPPEAAIAAPWLGIQGVSDSTAVAKGVRVLSVANGSPASLAKLKGDPEVGDIILAVGGTPVTSPEELSSAIRERAIGEKVPLTFMSGGLYRTVDILLTAPPVSPAALQASKKKGGAVLQPAAPEASPQASSETAPPEDDLFAERLPQPGRVKPSSKRMKAGARGPDDELFRNRR